MENNKIRLMLKENDIKVTDSRIEIINCLSDKKHFHSVAEISEHLEDSNTKTIYNNIKLLVSKGLIDSYSFGKISKYALNHHFKDEHNIVHIIDSNENLNHIKVSPEIIKKLKDEVKKTGHTPKSVSIFINVKK